MQTRAIVGVGLLCMTMGACDSPEVKACRGQYLATHAVVQTVDLHDLKQVDEALTAVRSTEAMCEQAQLKEELKNLKGVRTTLEGTSEYLHAYGNQKELTEAELEALAANGDPGCPKGQAYNYRKSGKQIRCTGPQLVTMNWEQAKAYYDGRGFKLTEDGGNLKAEFGSESYTFHFQRPHDPAPATCVEVFAPPGLPWQESVARFTGAAMPKLKKGEPVKGKSGTFELSHVDDETQAIYKLGKCPG